MSIEQQAAEVIEGYYPTCMKCRGVPEVGECKDCTESCERIANRLRHDSLLAPEMTTEYGFHYTGYPTTVADWQEWSEDPADNWVWFTDRDQRDEEGVHAEDTGFNVDYFTRQVTAPTPDDMEHIE